MTATTCAKRHRLDRPERVRRELAAVYRDCRSGRLGWAAGTKAAHILSSLLRAIEGTDLEARLARLEAQP